MHDCCLPQRDEEHANNRHFLNNSKRLGRSCFVQFWPRLICSAVLDLSPYLLALISNDLLLPASGVPTKERIWAFFLSIP